MPTSAANVCYFSGTTFRLAVSDRCSFYFPCCGLVLLRVEKEALRLLFLTQHIWSLFYFAPVKTGVNAAGGGGPIVAHTNYIKFITLPLETNRSIISQNLLFHGKVFVLSPFQKPNSKTKYGLLQIKIKKFKI